MIGGDVFCDQERAFEVDFDYPTPGLKASSMPCLMFGIQDVLPVGVQ